MALLLLMLISALLKSAALPPSEGLSGGELLLLNEQWEKTADTADGDRYSEYVCVLPETAEGRLVLSIESFWSSIQILLNGEELAAFTDTHKEYGSVRHWIELPEGCVGGTLSIRSDSGDAFLKQVISKKIYIGAFGAVFRKFFLENLFALIFACLTVMLSVFILLFDTALKKYAPENAGKGNRYLRIFIFLVGCWVLTDSKLLQLFTDKSSVVVLVSFLSFFAMPIFIMRFVQMTLTQKSKLLNIMSLLCFADMLVFLLNYIFRLTNMYKPLLLQHILMFVSIAAIIIVCAADIKRRSNNELKYILLGIGLLSLCGITAIFRFWQNPSSAYSKWCVTGILLFLICLECMVFKKMQQHLEQSINSRVYKELAYRDIMTQMYNRTAFIEEQNDQEIKAGRAVIMFDINRLKQTNDLYGHQTGDRLIIDSARCILESFSDAGKCYRYGGDEFVAVLDGLSEEEIEVRLSSLEQRLKQTDSCAELTYGCAIQGCRALTNDALFKEADANMYSKKQKS